MGKKVDKRDIAILWELFQNSRQPVTKIAKKVKIPKETVKYRMEQLMKSGILNKNFAIVNSAKFGFNFYSVYIKFQGIPKEFEKECIEKLKQHPLICWLISTSGKYSIHISFLVKDPIQFYECYNYVRSLFHKYVKELIVEHAVEGQQFDYPYFKNFKPIPVITATRQHESKTLSDTDIGILKILTDNSRTTIREISKKVKTTEVTVRSRIKWLEKNKFILKYTTLLHPGRTGYFFYLMLIRLDLPNKELEKYIKTIPELFYFVKSIGPHDFKVEFYVDTESRIHEIEEEIYQKYGSVVQHIEIMHVKKEHLVKYFVDVREKK